MERSVDDTENNGWSLKRPATPSQAIPIPSSKTRYGKLDTSSLPSQFDTPERTELYTYTREASVPDSKFFPLLFFTPPEDEHVTVWEPSTGKTVAGNAAPYRKNLKAWLETHPGWEEKADELKSSKRRSLLRRQKQVQAAFSSLVANVEVSTVLKASAEKVLSILTSGLKKDRQEQVDKEEASVIDSNTPNMQQDSPYRFSRPRQAIDWSSEETMRLQEALVYLGEEFMLARERSCLESIDKWRNMASYVFHKTIHAERDSWDPLEDDCVKDLLENTLKILEMSLYRRNLSTETTIASPFTCSLSSSPKAGDMYPSTENAFQMPSFFLTPSSFTGSTYREPRITVWDPKTGRTISGNAAPCAKNLESWMASHPGWVPKSEEYLSSARRVRHRKAKGRTSSTSGEVAASAPAYLSLKAPSSEDHSHGNSFQLSSSLQLAESPAFNDALDGLLLMQICNQSNSNQTQLHSRSTENPSSSSVSSGSQDKLWDKVQETGMEDMDMELEDHDS